MTVQKRKGQVWKSTVPNLRASRENDLSESKPEFRQYRRVLLQMNKSYRRRLRVNISQTNLRRNYDYYNDQVVI